MKEQVEPDYWDKVARMVAVREKYSVSLGFMQDVLGWVEGFLEAFEDRDELSLSTFFPLSGREEYSEALLDEIIHPRFEEILTSEWLAKHKWDGWGEGELGESVAPWLSDDPGVRATWVNRVWEVKRQWLSKYGRVPQDALDWLYNGGELDLRAE